MQNPESSLDRETALAQAMKVMTGPSNVLSRSQYTEQNLLEAFGQGITQYVILGAGLDTFAYRHPELLKTLHVFELDHPVTQNFKRQRLSVLNWDAQTNLHFIPIDFAKQSLTQALETSAYDPKQKTMFSWFGVTMYLTRDNVLTTLNDITNIAPSGSSIIFDYLSTDAFAPTKLLPVYKQC